MSCVRVWIAGFRNCIAVEQVKRLAEQRKRALAAGIVEFADDDDDDLKTLIAKRCLIGERSLMLTHLPPCSHGLPSPVQ